MESTCDICMKKLKNSHNLARHKRNIHRPEERKYKCTLCEKLYTRNDVLRRHSLSIHETEEIRFETVTYKRRPQVPMTIEKPKPRGSYQSRHSTTNHHRHPPMESSETSPSGLYTMGTPWPITHAGRSRRLATRTRDPTCKATDQL